MTIELISEEEIEKANEYLKAIEFILPEMNTKRVTVWRSWIDGYICSPEVFWGLYNSIKPTSCNISPPRKMNSVFFNDLSFRIVDAVFKTRIPAIITRVIMRLIREGGDDDWMFCYRPNEDFLLGNESDREPFQGRTQL